MSKLQCPCQDPENIYSTCPACLEQEKATPAGSVAFCYIEMPDGSVSGCADGCPCDDTGFVEHDGIESTDGVLSTLDINGLPIVFADDFKESSKQNLPKDLYETFFGKSDE